MVAKDYYIGVDYAEEDTPETFLANLDNFNPKDMYLSNPCPLCGKKILLSDDTVKTQGQMLHLSCVLKEKLNQIILTIDKEWSEVCKYAKGPKNIYAFKQQIKRNIKELF